MHTVARPQTLLAEPHAFVEKHIVILAGRPDLLAQHPLGIFAVQVIGPQFHRSETIHKSCRKIQIHHRIAVAQILAFGVVVGFIIDSQAAGQFLGQQKAYPAGQDILLPRLCPGRKLHQIERPVAGIQQNRPGHMLAPEIAVLHFPVE